MTDTPWVHEFSATIPAARDRVFAALTEPEQLRQWFAESVEVEPVVGAPWRCWGRYTPGIAARGHAEDRLLAWEPPGLIQYAWRFMGCPSTVTLTLVADPQDAEPSTRLAVRHELTRTPSEPRSRELVDDFWRLAFGNLMAHLAGGAGIVRPDFADPRPEIRLSIVMDAPPEAVFQALLDPEALRQWVGATAPEVDPRVGGVYRYGWKYPIEGREVEGGPMTILELVPNRLLVTDWPDWRGDPTVPLQRIEWHLAPEGAGTRVTLVHSGFTRTADISDYPFGWGHFLGALETYLRGI